MTRVITKRVATVILGDRTPIEVEAEYEADGARQRDPRCDVREAGSRRAQGRCIVKALVLLVLLVLAGCGTVLAPDPLKLTGVRSATPDQVEYATDQYQHVELCLGLAGNVERVLWRTAASITVGGREPAGVGRNNTIYILADLAEVVRLPSGRLIGTRWLWRHESMHHILGIATGDDDPDHRHASWLECTGMPP